MQSLDLEQTAIAHLYSVLNRIPTISQHPELPEFVRRGIPRPEISDEQKAALHTVTSSLFSRPNVRTVMDSTIAEVCMVLDVQPPEKKRSRNRKADVVAAAAAAAAEKTAEPETAEKTKSVPAETKKMSAKDLREEMRRKLLEGINMDEVSGDDDDDEEEQLADKTFNGFSDNDSDADTEDSDADNDDDDDAADGPDVGSDEEEAAISKMASMLGGSDDDDNNDSGSDSASDVPLRKGKPVKTVRVRDISVSVSPSGSSAEESSSEDDTLRSKNTRANKQAAKKQPAAAAGDSTFLPTLMGGYVSGSESEASDLDIAPARKNRLGQRQRQAIWEKKYGEKAKHRQADAAKADAKWDAKRGAVYEGNSKPWKKGVDPFAKAEAADPDRKKDGSLKKPANGGVANLHPSWEARKKAQQKQKISIGGAPAAKKIKFDD